MGRWTQKQEHFMVYWIWAQLIKALHHKHVNLLRSALEVEDERDFNPTVIINSIWAMLRPVANSQEVRGFSLDFALCHLYIEWRNGTRKVDLSFFPQQGKKIKISKWQVRLLRINNIGTTRPLQPKCGCEKQRLVFLWCTTYQQQPPRLHCGTCFPHYVS